MTQGPLRTPDGRYIVVRGRLWSATNPQLSEAERQALVDQLMMARRAIGRALKRQDREGLAAAQADVQAAKVKLGERGPVWWADGAPDLNRRLACNTPYAAWYAAAERATDFELVQPPDSEVEERGKRDPGQVGKAGR